MTGQKATAWETGRSAEAAVWALRAADSAADLDWGDQVDPVNVEERAGALQELVEFVHQLMLELSCDAESLRSAAGELMSPVGEPNPAALAGWAAEHLDHARHGIDDAVREIMAARSSLSRLHLAEPAPPVSPATDTGAPRRRVSWAASRFDRLARRMSRGR